MKKLIQSLPKIELHLHIEGTLEPELMFRLAKKNHIDIPYSTVDEIKDAYNFTSLESFLELYYNGCNVLVHRDDFFQLTWQYLLKCKEQNIVHTEIMFDPQAHTQRGISFSTIILGIVSAMKQGEKELNISSFLILNLLRHLTQQEALDTLNEALEFRDLITAIGLDSSEIGNPPKKFKKVFALAKEYGFKLVAHAGEEAGSDYIWGAIKHLNIDRVDHGIQCENDDPLLLYLIQKQIPLTVCPLSNTSLKAVNSMTEHNILRLLRKDILVTVNSDDPAYFGGYLNDNFEALFDSLGMTESELIQLIKNSIYASFLSSAKKDALCEDIDIILNMP